METLAPLEKWEQDSSYRAAISLPREPKDEHIDADLHVAFALWRNPWENTGEDSLVHWLVVSHDIRAGFQFKYSSSRDPRPLSEVVENVMAAASASTKPAWVVAPRRQRGAARELLEKGFDITLGLSEENRAVAQLYTRMDAEKQLDAINAHRAGLVTNTPNQVNDETLDPLALPELNSPSVPYRWLPVYREVIPVDRRQVVLASDASPGQNGVAAMAVVSELGDFGLRTVSSKLGSVPLEFESIIMALGIVSLLGVEKATIQNDCESALLMAQLLIDNQDPAEGYCGISMAARDRFNDAIESLQCDVDFQHVRGHVGHPLNEAADSIANLARTAAVHPRAEIEADLLLRITNLRESIKEDLENRTMPNTTISS